MIVVLTLTLAQDDQVALASIKGYQCAQQETAKGVGACLVSWPYSCPHRDEQGGDALGFSGVKDRHATCGRGTGIAQQQVNMSSVK